MQTGRWWLCIYCISYICGTLQYLCMVRLAVVTSDNTIPKASSSCCCHRPAQTTGDSGGTETKPQRRLSAGDGGDGDQQQQEQPETAGDTETETGYPCQHRQEDIAESMQCASRP